MTTNTMQSKLPSIKAKIDESQAKKILKDQRKKIYADLLVQGTNDSSIVSKRSVEKLYSLINDEPVPHFFQHFVKKPQRRSPAINRGYWIRMNAIKNCVDKIVKAQDCKTNVIVNLGCGYDPLPFQVIDKKLKFLPSAKSDMDFLCIDIDYPELISQKVHMIKNSPELMDIIGEPQVCDIEGVQLKTSNYAAVGCNLRDLKLFQSQMTQLGLHLEDTCSIFIAEVSLAYMQLDHADAIIKETSTFPKSHFVILEQLLPTDEKFDPFGRTMLHHFSRLNTPLKCVPVYRTVPSQILRFELCGFPNVEARDLLGCWDELVKEDEKTKVRKVEAFDELEEFIFYTQHYIVLHATNAIKCCFNNENKWISCYKLTQDDSIKLSYDSIADPMHRKFAAVSLTKDNDCIVVGGSSQVRLNTSVILTTDPNTSLSMTEHKLPQRMCHTLTALPNEEFILVGGRNAPHKPFQDCWKLTKDNDVWKWKQCKDLPEARSRHSAVRVNDKQILFFGGLDNSGSPFILYDSENDTWKDVTITGDDIVNMKSAAMTFDIETQTGFILGGVTNESKWNDTLYKFQYKENVVSIQSLFKHDLLQRYGTRISQVSKDKLIIVGGVSLNFALDKTTTIMTIELSPDYKLQSVNIRDDLWQDGNMLVGFEMLQRPDGSILCVGGGAVCFGFGSFWNEKILVISHEQTQQRQWIPILEKST